MPPETCSRTLTQKNEWSWGPDSDQVSLSDRGQATCSSVRHGEELKPVVEEPPVVLAGVDHQAEQMAATRLIAQGDLGFALRHVEADVQDLEEQQVEQTQGHHAAVPGTGEGQRRAGENNTTGKVQHLGPLT